MSDRITLYHGDCLEIMAAMPDRSVDFIFTDPPYGHNNNNNGDLISRRERALGKVATDAELPPPRLILNDGPEAEDLFRAALGHFARLLRSGGCCCCCCGGGGPDPQFARWSLMMDEHLEFKQMVVWDKGPMGLGWHYRRSYETVLVGMRPGAPCRWYDSSHRIENIIRPGMGIRKIVPRPHQHPTEKPVGLAAHFIRLHTGPGDVVLDPFMGVGSTGEAALRLGRRFIGIELDAHWYAEAQKRLDAVAAQGLLPLDGSML